jgi:hypothetical protein
MIEPVRIQLSRAKGFNLQEASRQINGLSAVVVARPTEWGNPYVVGEPADRKQAKRWGWWPLSQPDYVAPTQEAAARRFGTILCLDAAIHQHVRDNLAGKNLACWCAHGEPCHADYLLKVAATKSKGGDNG